MIYNKNICELLKSNKLDSLNFQERLIYSKKDINKIVSNYGIYKEPEMLKISIEYVIGKSRGKTQNILEELNELFNEDGNNYQRRSISMLRYSTEDILKKLHESFYNEPIELNEIEKGKFVVENNGMHRCTLIRFHYLKELSKCKNKNEVDNLRKKFVIIANVRNLDIIKTYSQFLISMLNREMYIENRLNEYNKPTGEIVLYNHNVKEDILNDSKLIEFVINNIKNIPEEKLEIEDQYFKNFINDYIKRGKKWKN